MWDELKVTFIWYINFYYHCNVIFLWKSLNFSWWNFIRNIIFSFRISKRSHERIIKFHLSKSPTVSSKGNIYWYYLCFTIWKAFSIFPNSSLHYSKTFRWNSLCYRIGQVEKKDLFHVYFSVVQYSSQLSSICYSTKRSIKVKPVSIFKFLVSIRNHVATKE